MAIMSSPLRAEAPVEGPATDWMTKSPPVVLRCPVRRPLRTTNSTLESLSPSILPAHSRPSERFWNCVRVATPFQLANTSSWSRVLVGHLAWV